MTGQILARASLWLVVFLKNGSLTCRLDTPFAPKPSNSDEVSGERVRRGIHGREPNPERLRRFHPPRPPRGHVIRSRESS